MTPIRPLTAEVPTNVLMADNRSSSESSNYTGNLNYVYADTRGGLTYQLNRKNQFALNYGRRVTA